jgi:Uncharacterized proteins of the AP superfamily
MGVMYPNYENCLVNLSNSILKYYGAKTHHSTLRELDDILAKNYKNVVLVLYDGFGSSLISRNLGTDSFLHRNKRKDITSVFPATTTAATTSVLTGLTPAEHCWLGWDTYIPSADKIVTMFLNVVKGTDEKAADYNLPQKEFAYTNIIEKINNAGNAKAYCVSPFEGITYDVNNYDEMYEHVLELCSIDENKFIYAYCDQPDHLMHILGTDDEKITELMKTLDYKTEEFCAKLDDTLIIVTADHGHMTAGDSIILDDYPTLKDMLIRETSLEQRAVSFFVKTEMLDAFKQEFNRLFAEDFILLTKQEVLDRKLFGDGIVHSQFEACLGEYLAISLSDKAIFDERSSTVFKGLHAGLMEDEVLIPFIAVEKP